MPVYEEKFKLWNGVPPFAGPEDALLKEHFTEEPDGIERITDVATPTVTWYPCTCRRDHSHPVALVCPGGGYGILAWNLEGRDICAMLNRNGFSAFLLKYRCPQRRKAAHADAARAIRFIRANAEKFDIDPKRVGIIGFSAGAHLSATVSAPACDVPYPPVDDMDKFPFRPDFTALVYPWDLTYDDLSLHNEFKIDENTPPTLLIQTEDDSVRPENSIAWFLALKRAGRPAEMHIWPSGGHGYGVLRTGDPCEDWDQIAGTWFRRQAGIK